MHTRDIERLRAQVRRVANLTEEIIDDADTIGEAGFDPSQSEKVLDKQQEMVTELSQAFADFDELMNRAEYVDSGDVEYEPSGTSLSVSYDDDTDEVTVEYTGGVTVKEKDISVLEEAAELDMFNGALSPDTTVTQDVSGLNNGDEFVVEITQHRVEGSRHNIRSWDEILAKKNAGPPSVSPGGIKLPEHNLTKETQSLTRRTTIDRTSSE